MTHRHMQRHYVRSAVVRAAAGSEILIVHEHETEVPAGIGELGAFGNREGIMIGRTDGNAGDELDRRLVPDAQIVREIKSVREGAGTVTAGEWVVSARVKSGKGNRF